MTTTLVVFLKGGADGGTLVAPSKENSSRAHYESLRPNIKIESECKLGSDFILNEHLKPLMEHFEAKDLSIYAGIGGSMFYRSHFEQIPAVQFGTTKDHKGSIGVFATDSQNPLDTVALEQKEVLQIFRGYYTSGFAIPSPKSMRSFYNPNYHMPHDLDEVLEDYQDTDLHDEAQQALEVLKTSDIFSKIDFGDESKIRNEARHLARQGTYIKADTEKKMQFLSYSIGGWDHHTDINGNMSRRLPDLAEGLSQCWKNLGDRQKDTNIVVITEFGRTYKQNGAAGLDHGYGTVAFLFSKQIQEGFVQKDWWDLSEDSEFRAFGEKHNALKPSMEYNELFDKILATHS